MYNVHMLIDLAPYRRRLRFKMFMRLCAYYRRDGCTKMEAARFARQTLDISPPRRAKIYHYGQTSNLSH